MIPEERGKARVLLKGKTFDGCQSDDKLNTLLEVRGWANNFGGTMLRRNKSFQSHCGGSGLIVPLRGSFQLSILQWLLAATKRNFD